MSDLSIFPDKSIQPTDKMLAENLKDMYPLWRQLYDEVFRQYPDGKPEWNFPGKKYGWSFRIKDKKRAIIYFLPHEGYFKAAFVFGDKAVAEIMKSKISDSIKTELNEARKYAEGRGIRIKIENENDIDDISRLIEIKLKY